MLSLALVAVSVGYLMVILDTTIVNVALPALRADLRASVSGLQWVVDGYLLMFAALLLSGGALADRLGAREVFQGGLGLFIVASVGCGLAPSTVVLVIARLVQGVGAAVSVPASLALVRAAYPDPAARARAIGVWGGIAGVAAASGPILGGILVSAVSWRAVFFVNVPIGIAAMALTARHVPAPNPEARPLDRAAQVTGVLALAALTLALTEGGHAGFTPLVTAPAVVFVAASWAFITIERSVRSPMLPLGLFANANFSGGTAVGLLINLGFYGELFVIKPLLPTDTEVHGRRRRPSAAASDGHGLGWLAAIRSLHQPCRQPPPGDADRAAGRRRRTARAADRQRRHPIPAARRPAGGRRVRNVLHDARGDHRRSRKRPGRPGRDCLRIDQRCPPTRRCHRSRHPRRARRERATFLPGLRIALIIAGGAFLATAAVTAVTIGRPAPGDR